MSWETRLSDKLEWEAAVRPLPPHLIWTGAKNKYGYPYMRNEQGKVELVSKVMWRRAGRKPARLKNICGRNDCVAPSHWVEL